MKHFLAVASMLLSAAPALAQDQQLGARTKAMGGSYTAFEDDPVSIWLNPAGIATQPDQFALAYQTYTTYPLQKDFAGAGIETTAEAKTSFVDPAIIPSFLGLVFQVGSAEDPMAIGICFARPYHVNYSLDKVEDPGQTAFVPEANVEESFTRFRVAFAKDFRFKTGQEEGFLTHLSAALAVDIGYERWRFDTAGSSSSDTATAPGFGAGLLLGVYDNRQDFKINFGLAYQSAVHWDFNIDPRIAPAFDMPQQINVGATGYLLEEQRLRMTFDVQWVEWSKTAEEPAFLGKEAFRDSVNFSFGAEYRYSVTERIALFPRAGVRLFSAPWSDKDDLPFTSNYKLVLDTKGSEFTVGTLGLGLSYTDARGKIWTIDLGVDFGGDSANMALGFTYEL